MLPTYENQITVADLEAFVEKQGGRSSKVFSILGKSATYMNAFASEVGQQLLQDGLKYLDERLNKIVNMKAIDDEIAEYRAMKSIMDSWAARVNVYLENHNKVKDGGGNGKTSKI